MTSIAPAAQPRVIYVYDKQCEVCGGAFQSRRHDARHCKRCKWRLRAQRYKAKHPERVLAYKRSWNAAHMDKRRAHKKASYWRHLETNRERNRRYCAAHPRGGPRFPWEQDLAKQIRQIAII